ncbi:hypothetical protein C9374_006320 [Naegleria lovaniensis]|uniref:Uncharacterized protein n=1 Tax=Naegleria lovaniensis TaxID=51637 RepID=A0AA88GI09_NAELO|nr:uncharacterized protein C9374_006320 [Naegleria lovaniensis]KAG2381331.1 hypothetical protein C9374_006320 [Naegleria lovaniensis]
MKRVLVPFALTLSLPLISSYQIYRNPQRTDVLTENFIKQFNDQSEQFNHTQIESIKNFNQNDIERKQGGGSGHANVSFVVSTSSPNKKQELNISFGATLTHFIWMYNHVKINSNDNSEIKEINVKNFKPFDDTFHSSNGYYAHQLCCLIPVLHFTWILGKVFIKK